MFAFIMDNIYIVIPCVVAVLLFFAYNNTTDDKPKEVEPEKEVLPNFLAYDKFAGEKHGYIFKMDNQGLGYYKDAIF